MKNDVLDEIKLPAQNENIQYLYFSPVENYFYKRQHEECSNNVREMLVINGNTNHLSTKKKNNMLLPLLRLRQVIVDNTKEFSENFL